MKEMLSDIKTWFTDMKENPEIIASELANVGGKIGRGVAALVGGTVEAVGAVGAAAVDITASGVGGAVDGLCGKGCGDGIAKAGETAAHLIKKPFGKVSDCVRSGAAVATFAVSKTAGDIGGVMEAKADIEVHGSPALKAVLGLRVKPKRGSIVKVELALGAASHTGVYVAPDEIVEIYVEDSMAIVRKVTETEFLSCSSIRTGSVISVAASDRAALNSEEIAVRAEAELERCAGKRGEYGLFSNNCHAFTRYCITGERSIEGTFGEAEIESALESVFKTHVVWIPMGKRNDMCTEGLVKSP